MNQIPSRWTQIEIAGHACDVFEPAEIKRSGQAIIYLHGVHLTRLVENAAFTAEFTRLGVPVICPMTQRSWWTDRICTDFDPQLTAERHVVQNIVPYLAERWSAKPPGLAIFGTSMGGQGALRLAFKHPNVFPVVAALSPAIDYQSRWKEGDETIRQMYPDAESVRQDTATLHVHPLNWPRNIWFACDPEDYRWHDSADRLRMKLGAIGIPHEHDLQTSAGGHGFQYYNHMAPRALAFIADRLDKEQRRVM